MHGLDNELRNKRGLPTGIDYLMQKNTRAERISAIANRYVNNIEGARYANLLKNNPKRERAGSRATKYVRNTYMGLTAG